MKKKFLRKQKNQLDNYIKYSSLAFQMGGIIALFCWLGVWLDDYFETETSWFAVSGSLLGVFGSLYAVLKQLLQKNE